MASDNQAVIITGAASGMGLAMTIALLTNGHDVTAVDRNGAALAELTKRAANLRGAVNPVTADLAQADSFNHIASSALIRFGRIDALVNNAGIGQAAIRADQRANPIRFWDTTPEQWARFMAINGAAPINMARAVLPHMLTAKKGRIITVTTSLGTMVKDGYLLYGSSKAAAESAMAVLAADLAGTGVTSNILVPGGTTNTPLVGEAGDPAKMLQPEIMGPPLLWLLSDEATAVNGRRYIAADWNTSLAPAQAAEKAGAPIAWMSIARMPIQPG
ncbi:MAG: SDR family oxidoreductase [Acetobacteraceae bacterium]|nr:SDR family oxidoreductase [Acetobacteraceae bacterium]MSP29998.1 SDR family oxidoreductase [Acetobacteraceae bacterium]